MLRYMRIKLEKVKFLDELFTTYYNVEWTTHLLFYLLFYNQLPTFKV